MLAGVFVRSKPKPPFLSRCVFVFLCVFMFSIGRAVQRPSVSVAKSVAALAGAGGAAALYSSLRETAKMAETSEATAAFSPKVCGSWSPLLVRVCR